MLGITCVSFCGIIQSFKYLYAGSNHLSFFSSKDIVEFSPHLRLVLNSTGEVKWKEWGPHVWCAGLGVLLQCVPGKSLMEKSGRNAAGLSRYQRTKIEKNVRDFYPILTRHKSH